ncbi:PrgI family protein [Lachnospiraceae bacterium KH1T2]|nr:PrgI family protein [Lachnospiraceae bacterium KH1T2]
MASYIAVPRDLTKVKSKVMFNMTKRQLVCFSLAALIGVPSFFLLKSFGDTSFAAMGMIILMMPMFFVGMYQKNGQPLEVIFTHFAQANFIRPKIRLYKTDNYYEALHRQAVTEKEVNRIVRKYNAALSEKGNKSVRNTRISEQRRQKIHQGDHRESKKA